ncbi:MAG: malonate decarboxylase subunit epsilon [Azospirillaceae bacterium]|nr:malonate decarboxylase subunit epsilon [Azospirillaceae bacterium]
MTTLLFPGQGAQTPGFLHQLPDHPAVVATLAEASAVLGFGVRDLDDAAALQSTVAVQLTAVIAGVAVARALADVGVAIDAVAGLSVGSFTAAVVAGSLSFAAALPLVKLRGELMAAAYPRGYGMAVFVGLGETRLSDLVATINSPTTPLFLANFNAPTEIVATGAIVALDALIAAATQAGARKAEQIAVSVPSHCPLLSGVSEKLAQALGDIAVTAPRLTYVGNRRARVLGGAEAVIEELATNVANPIRWHDQTTLLYELGERFFIEPPPGKALTGLISSAFPDVTARCACETPLSTLAYLARRSIAPS